MGVSKWRALQEKLLGKRTEGCKEWRGLCGLLVPFVKSFPVAKARREAQGALAMPHCPETAGTTTSVLHPYNLNSPLRPWTHTHRPPDRASYKANESTSSRIQGLLRWRDWRWTGKGSINIFCSPEPRTAEGEFVLTYASDHTCSAFREPGLHRGYWKVTVGQRVQKNWPQERAVPTSPLLGEILNKHLEGGEGHLGLKGTQPQKKINKYRTSLLPKKTDDWF